MKKQNSSQPKGNFVSQPSSERKFNPPSREVSHAEIYSKKLGNILNDINGILLEKEIEQVAANQINNLKISHQQMMNVSENHYKESMDKFENIGEKMLNKFESRLFNIQQEINKSNQKFNKQLKQSMMSTMMQSMREMSKNLINQFRQQTKQVKVQQPNNMNKNQPLPPTTYQQYSNELRNCMIAKQGVQSLKQIMLQLNANVSYYLQQSIRVQNLNNSCLQTLAANHKQKRRTFSIFQASFASSSPTAPQIKQYITIMLTEIASISFNLYFSDKLQFEKVKCYFCESFLLNVANLLNIVGLSQFNHIIIQIIDTHLSQLALPFLKHNYPHSEEKQVSRQLLKRIENKDIFNENRFDIIQNSKVKMTWHGKDVKDRDIYDTQREIMKVLNYIIDLPDTPLDSVVGGSAVTLYEQFQQDMGTVFCKVYDKKFVEKMYKLNSKEKTIFCEKFNQEKDWKEKKKMLDSFQLGETHFMKKYFSTSEFQRTDSKIKLENEDQQYRQKVQAYTKYRIGRKISANSKKYDTMEIEEGKLTIKDSGIMRVLTKWVESILQDFRSPQKVTTEKDEPHRLFEGGQLEWQDGIDKKQLYNKFVKKSKKIFQQLGTLKNKLSSFIASTIQSHKKQQQYQCSYSQDIVGYVSSFVSKANQNYVINQINKLIQHIKQIQNIHATKINTTKKVMLVNMKLGDLMRCQITSKQKQIIAVYEYLCLLCQTSPQAFELVRVKNRFNGPNKDIMINIFYRQKIMIQVQLAIKNDSSFIECSDKYSHFIYELSRNFLGPFSEICNVWNKFSPTANVFNKRILQNQKSARDLLKIQDLPCIKHTLMANGQVFYLPFWCGNCGKFQNQFNRASQCKICKHKLCKYCTNLIKNQNKFQNKKRQTKINLFSTKCYQIFNYISNRMKNMVIIQILTKSYIFTFDMNQAQQEIVISNIKMELEFTEQTKQKQKKQFVQLNFIEQTDIECDQEIISQILIEWWLKQKLKSINKLKKKRIEFLVTTNPRIDIQKFNTRLVKTVFKQQNVNKMSSLQKVSFFVAKIQRMEQRFKQMKKLNSFIGIKTKIEHIELPTNKLKEINLMENNLNDLSNIVHLSQSSQLEKLDLSSNKLESIEKFSQYKLTSLEKLNLANNKIRSPKGIQNLKKLEKLILSQNKLLNLYSVNEITQLRELILVNCGLKSLKELESLGNLQVLQVRQNNLASLQGIQNCKKLTKIDASRNKQLSDLSPLKDMNQLKFLHLKENNLQTLKNMPQLKNLQYLGLQNNNLTSSEMFDKQLPTLKYLILKNNKISSLQWLTNCQNIQQLDLQQNGIETILLSEPISSLKILKIGNNKIKKIDGLNYFINLDILDISHNEIEETVDFPHLVHVRLLLLNDNKIQNINLPNLQKLVKLYAFNNQIMTIEGISKSANLQKLLLQSNKIEHLKGIENLLNLTELNIVENKIKSISNLQVCQNIQRLNITLHQDLQKQIILNKFTKLTVLNGEIINKSADLDQKHIYQLSLFQQPQYGNYTSNTREYLGVNTRSVGGSYVQQEYKTENFNQQRNSIPPTTTQKQKNNEKHSIPRIIEQGPQQGEQPTMIQYMYRKYIAKNLEDTQEFGHIIEREVDKQGQLYIAIQDILVPLNFDRKQISQSSIRQLDMLASRKMKEKNGSKQSQGIRYSLQFISDEIRQIYKFTTIESMPLSILIKGLIFHWLTCKKVLSFLVFNQSQQRQKLDHKLDKDLLECNLYIDIFELLFVQKNSGALFQSQISIPPQNHDEEENGETLQSSIKNTAHFGGAR